MKNFCWECDGWGWIAKPGRGWRIWQTIPCDACEGDGYARPPHHDGPHPMSPPPPPKRADPQTVVVDGRTINSDYQWNFVAVPRAEYEQLLKLGERVKVLETLQRKHNVWDWLRRYHRRLNTAEETIGRMEKEIQRLARPLPLFRDCD